MASLETGTRIADWIVDSALDEGGMGAVYRCHNALSERIQGALKVMDRHRADVSRDRFIREVEALASLRHEAVVRILGFGEAPEIRAFYIAMELVQGDSLAKRIAEGPWVWPGPREVFVKLASGLAHAHARGIAHRDIKPQNLMYTEDGSACIIDFGISAAEGRTSLTSEGMFLGTVTHMAPELFGQGHVDPMKADIYALGQVFYEVLTGTRAFSAQSALTAEQRMVYVMAAKMNSEALDPGPACPPALRALIRDATHPDPSQRAVDLPRFVRALEAVSQDPVLVEPGAEPAAGSGPPDRAPLAPTEMLRSPTGSGPQEQTSQPVPPPPVVPATGSGRRPDPGIPTRSGRKPLPFEIDPTADALPEDAPEPEPEPEPELSAAPSPPDDARARQRHSVFMGLGVGLLIGVPLALLLVGWQLGWFGGEVEAPVTPITPSEQRPPAEPPDAATPAPIPTPTPTPAPTSAPKKARPAEAPRETTRASAPAAVDLDVPMRLDWGLSLEGDLYIKALTPLLEGRRSSLEACFGGAGVEGVRTDVRVVWTLESGAITAGPTASGGPDALGRCLTGIIKKIPFDSMQSGTATLDLEYFPQP